MYSRSVNKTSLAARVVDQKDPKRNFTERELSDIMTIDNWVSCCLLESFPVSTLHLYLTTILHMNIALQVQCESCDKWRMLPPTVDTDTLPESWYCELNDFDKARSRCGAKERDAAFYHKFFLEQAVKASEISTESQPIIQDSQNSQFADSQTTLPRQSVDSRAPEDDEKIANTRRDVILSRLLDVQAPRSSKKKGQAISPKDLITKHFFHDSLMKEAGPIGDLPSALLS